MSLKLVVMGTPDFPVPAFTALAERHQILCAYSQPPRPAGRGKQLQPSPVQRWAEARGIPVRHPVSLKTPEAQAEFAALGADAAVVAAYGLILPQPVLDAPRLGCFNIHGSLLPRWRGAAPIQRAILAGDAETGITIMRMEAGLDTGPMLLREGFAIGEADTGALHDKLAALGARMVVEALEQMPAPQPQPEEGVTYAAKLQRAEERLDWSRPAEELARQIRAFAPYPGAWFEVKGERVKALAARQEQGSGTPGTLLDDALLVACGPSSSHGGALRLEKLQRAGGRPMPAADFLRGFPLTKGTVFAALEDHDRV